jgi:hypothetical protein
VSSETEFAAALHRALGPLYRITVLSSKGEPQATFGEIPSNRTERHEIPVAGSSCRLVLEIDAGTVEAARRLISSVAQFGRASEQEAPRGTFTHLDDALDELIALGEAQIGSSLAEMTRAQKQQLVRFLDGRGAFALRKAVDTVADALGVSRFTVYNYLDSSRAQ